MAIMVGDCRAVLAGLASGSAQACVTSPPYYGLRDYGHAGQIGLEQTPDAYVAEMVAVFRAVRRVLADDGTLWLNLGDAYASGTKGSGGKNPAGLVRFGRMTLAGGARSLARQSMTPRAFDMGGAKPKDLLMMPARVAIALRADGWWLRSDIIWHKPNPMPESTRDRPTSAHEHVFLLAKSARYHYDADAIREPSLTRDARRPYTSQGAKALDGRSKWRSGELRDNPDTSWRNARNVWTISPTPYKGAHFATMPQALAERCVLAGSRPGDTILDPFAGAGTTGLAAQSHGRRAALIELNPDYAALAQGRLDAAARRDVF